MTDKFVIEENIGADGKIVLQLPPNAPRGRIRITFETVEPPNTPTLSLEEEAALDAEIDALLTSENLHGLGQTAAEIAAAPEFGAWEHRDDIENGETYVEELREKRRFTW